MVGFKKSKRKTPIAAQEAGKSIGGAVFSANGVRKIHVVLRGIGPGRLGAVKGLQQGGLVVESVEDVTSFPHNGCRPRKPRRI
ncbi:small ribosomal subunit protein uS11m-like [Zophobas morio]|uniref:small ribosomal subunit protein uS11m-like n=1 Tax=Zophobas morio TaxID=2755281 RepID=UPI003082812E